MIIESVAAAGMLLQQINSVIQQVNEGRANVQQAMALLVADPKLLEDYDAAIRQQEQDRRAHAKMMAKRKRDRERLIQQLLVGGTTLIIGGGIAILIFVLILKAFG